MKTALAIFGAIALIGIIAFAGLVFVGVREADKIVDTAHTFADETVEAVGRSWDVDELISRGSPEFLAAGTREQFKQVTDLGARSVGALITAEPATCELTNYVYTTEAGRVGQASCTVAAAHERGTVSYELNLVYRDKNWKLLLFVFNANVEDEASVQVLYTVRQPVAGNAMQISFREKKIGYATMGDATIGVGARLNSKIENIAP